MKKMQLKKELICDAENKLPAPLCNGEEKGGGVSLCQQFRGKFFIKLLPLCRHCHYGDAFNVAQKMIRVVL